MLEFCIVLGYFDILAIILCFIVALLVFAASLTSNFLTISLFSSTDFSSFGVSSIVIYMGLMILFKFPASEG